MTRNGWDFLHTCDLHITHVSPLICVWVVVGQSDGEGDAVLVHQGKQDANA